MAPRHQGPRCEPALPQPDIPTKVQVQSLIPHWYVTYTPPPHRCIIWSHMISTCFHIFMILKLNSDSFIEPPEVTFVNTKDRPIPMHPHIYSNGIICLDLLGSQGWTPIQNVESICMSLQSMLTGNTKNERPEGDQLFVANNRRRPRDIDFYYHDNTV